ncbi:hypothetical protein ABZP36_001081 [Zizania latifolia]
MHFTVFIESLLFFFRRPPRSRNSIAATTTTLQRFLPLPFPLPPEHCTWRFRFVSQLHLALRTTFFLLGRFCTLFFLLSLLPDPFWFLPPVLCGHTTPGGKYRERQRLGVGGE